MEIPWLDQPTKAYLVVEGGRGRIECQFNPARLTLTKSAKWGSSTSVGTDAPAKQFQSGDSASLSMELTFDTTGTGKSVATYTSQLLDLVRIDRDLPSYNPQQASGRPPWVRFCWGDLHSFKGVVQNLTVNFTYFAASGRPLRAKVSLTLNQLDDEHTRPLQNPTSFTPAPHAVHVVRPGETLDRIAAARYQDSGKWRLIAETNAVLDPLNVPAGTTLIIPEQPVRRRGQ